MKPKNFPRRKYRRQLRANMKVWEMLGVPITWEMRAVARSTSDMRHRIGAKARGEHGQFMPRYTGRSADFIIHDDIVDTVQYSYAAMKADIEAFRIMFPSTAQLWKHPNVTP